MPLARAGERPPARSSPEREGARSPPAPQTRDTDHRAASPLAQTSMAACPRLPEPSCSYRLRDTDTDRSIFTRRARRNRCPKSPPPLALPPAVGPGENKRTRPELIRAPFSNVHRNSRQGVATTTGSAQPSPSDTPSAWRRPASSLRWVASATLTTMLSPKPSTASTRPRSSIGVDHGAHARPVEFATHEWVDWFNNRRLLEPIGNIPPAEAEERYYAMLNESAMAA